METFINILPYATLYFFLFILFGSVYAVNNSSNRLNKIRLVLYALFWWIVALKWIIISPFILTWVAISGLTKYFHYDLLRDVKDLLPRKLIRLPHKLAHMSELFPYKLVPKQIKEKPVIDHLPSHVPYELGQWK